VTNDANGMTMSDLDTLQSSALGDIAGAASLDALDAIRVALLGKSGAVTAQLKALGALPPEQRKVQGEQINRVKDALGEAIAARKADLEEAAFTARLASERIDISLPGRDAERGAVHPVTRTLDRITAIFAGLGYQVADGPEIEDDWHNFEALNFPPHHPARAMHDTFYFPDGRLLRTHTSPVQIRSMLGRTPPIRIIAPGKVYRSDSDQTHTPMFHQVEGLLVDETSSFADLKGHPEAVRRRLLRARLRNALPPQLFPLHRAVRRSRHPLGPRRRQRTRLAGSARLRHGAPQRAAPLRHRPGALQRLRLRPRRRTLRHAALRGQRPAQLL
jgi:phenylalanyl-tRNA synthetase alpha chain